MTHGVEGFVICTDAYNQGYGVIDMQNDKVAAYVFYTVKSHGKNLPTHDLELGVLVFCTRCGDIIYMELNLRYFLRA